MNVTKVCTKCLLEKSIDEFGKHVAGLHGKRAVCKCCNTQANREYVEHNKLKARRSQKNCWLKQQYGITIGDYEAMLAKQGGACAICRERTATPLHVDHCHASGKVRALLCFRCNTCLGRMNDSPGLLRGAAEYLEAHRG